MTSRDGLPEARTVQLRDGTRVLLRPIEPGDKDELRNGFDRLSRRSRYRRFFTAMDRLSDRQLAFFTEVDYHDHFAWVALAVDEPGQPGIAVARYIRLADDPEAADIALAVLDEYQGRGLGGLLLEALVEVALANGIRRFVGHVLADNTPMLRLLQKAGAETRWEEPGVLILDVDLPATAEELRTTHLYEVLRDAARSAADDPG